VPDIDVVDSTWIGAAPARVAAAVGDPANWPRWWPKLELSVVEARGIKGMRWAVRVADLTGNMEIWLQPVFDGVVLHYFLGLDAVSARPLTTRRRDRIARDTHRRAKQIFWALGDELDPGRIDRCSPRSARG
jgi:hypothetical protein